MSVLNLCPTLPKSLHKPLRWIGAALLVGLLQGCANTTDSGAIGLQRSQLLLISSEELNAKAAQGFQQLSADAQSKKKLNTDARLTQRVRRIGNDLIAQVSVFRADAKDWDWEINVFDSDEINAFCAPGGKIGVYTGIVKRLKLTDDELAAVMGHEIAHALREHSREKASQQMVSNLLVTTVSAAAKVDGSLLDMGSQMFVHLPNSRSMELESDVMGLELMARAGYDPRNAPKLWEKMRAASGGNKGLAFMSTHPADEERIAAMQENIPKVVHLYEEARARKAASAGKRAPAARKKGSGKPQKSQ